MCRISRRWGWTRTPIIFFPVKNRTAQYTGRFFGQSGLHWILDLYEIWATLCIMYLLRICIDKCRANHDNLGVYVFVIINRNSNILCIMYCVLRFMWWFIKFISKNSHVIYYLSLKIGEDVVQNSKFQEHLWLSSFLCC